jgi:NAD(P)H-hydrate epimerase
MTVGGTGDVLSGIVAAFLARNRNALESASAAAFVNGLAGKLVQRKIGLHMVATDLIEALPTVLKPFDRVR